MLGVETTADQPRMPLHQEFEIGQENNLGDTESPDLSPRVKLSIGVAFSVSLLVGFFFLGPVAHEGMEYGPTSKFIAPFASRPGRQFQTSPATLTIPQMAATDGGRGVTARIEALQNEVKELKDMLAMKGGDKKLYNSLSGLERKTRWGQGWEMELDFKYKSLEQELVRLRSRVAEFEQTQGIEQSEAQALGAKPAYANLKTGAAAVVAAIGLKTVFSPIASRRLSVPRMSVAQSTKKSGIDFPLLICFALWYLGNYYYNITNKLALNAAGGASGFPMTIATLQLGVGVIYALFMWLAPDAREWPKLTKKDLVKTLPVGICSAGAHAASVFALSAGAVSFAQIVKAAEPAFAAVIGVALYGAKVSKAKWLCLIPVIGGVCLASLGELSFAWAALGTAAIANVFAAVKANENKKLMETEGLKDRMGSVGNQFALTTITAFLACLPVWLLTEAKKFGSFMKLFKSTPAVSMNLVYSGLWFYLYNELATLTIKKTGAVTQSVANTAKRVIVIIVVALVMGESLGALKLIGCGIGIGGVFLYSIIDKLVAGKKDTPAPAPAAQAEDTAEDTPAVEAA